METKPKSFRLPLNSFLSRLGSGSPLGAGGVGSYFLQ